VFVTTAIPLIQPEVSVFPACGGSADEPVTGLDDGDGAATDITEASGDETLDDEALVVEAYEANCGISSWRATRPTRMPPI
jgi:hypothetical protein